MIFNAKEVDRFWSKVDKSGDCWLWTKGKAVNGYGKLQIGKATKSAHRTSYEIAFGKIPDGYCVCHRCDVKLCVNPDHLFLGTQLDNIADRQIKNRQAKGAMSGPRLHPESRERGDNHWTRRLPNKVARGNRNGLRLHPEKRAYGKRNGHYTNPDKTPRGEAAGLSKVTNATVKQIRDMYEEGKHSQMTIASIFGLGQSTVSSIIRRKTWAHIK